VAREDVNAERSAFPLTPVGRALEGLLQTLNTGDKTALHAFVKGHFDDTYRYPGEWPTFGLTIYRRTGGLVVERIERTSRQDIVAQARGKVDQRGYQLQIRVAAEAPYHISQFSMHVSPRPATGLLDVGGYRLAIYSAGSGSPAVVLDAGGGDGSESWDWVADAVAQFTLAVTYDRPGRGGSEVGPFPRTAHDMAEDLHTLLAKAGIPAPYVLVGHSLAGFIVRIYTSTYPDDVAGLVLVDTPHEDWFARFVALLPPEDLGEAASLARLRYRWQHHFADPSKHPESMDWPATLAQARAAGTLGDRPLVVLAAGMPTLPPDLPTDLRAADASMSVELRKELATLSTRSTLIVAGESGHYIQLDQPELVIDAIRQVVEAARSHG
jgi:pimeloyl-ACP methyl ester carboxylesterase